MFKIEVRRFDFSNETAGMMGHFGRDPFSFTVAEKAFLWRTQYEPRGFVLSREDRAAGLCQCSVCGTAFEAEQIRRASHKDKVACPHCGEALVVEHVWRMSKDLSDVSLVYQWRRSAKEPGALICRAVEVHRRWGTDGYDAKARVMGFYVFRPGDGGWEMDCRHGVYTVRRRTGSLDDLYMVCSPSRGQ